MRKSIAPPRPGTCSNWSDSGRSCWASSCRLRNSERGIRNSELLNMPVVRLQKILSAAGIASRRAAETLIAQGRVTVNGRTVSEPGSKADPAGDDIRVDGRRVKAAEPLRYLLLPK